MGLRIGNKAFNKKVSRSEGVSVVVGDACVACGTCAQPEVCSASAITLGPNRAEIDLQRCVGCGHCMQVCPEGVISFVFDPEVDVGGRLLNQVEAVTSVE